MVKVTALRKRYIAFRVQCSTIQFDEEKLKRAIYFEALKFFGEYGLSFAALKLISYDREKQIAILRCERDHYQRTLGFLALVNELDNKPTRTIAIAGSGTLAALRKRVDLKKPPRPKS